MLTPAQAQAHAIQRTAATDAAAQAKVQSDRWRVEADIKEQAGLHRRIEITAYLNDREQMMQECRDAGWTVHENWDDEGFYLT